MRKHLPLAAVLLVIVATALLRIHLLQTPLERDEGEYAYAGQLMLQAIPPYQLATNMKLPGTYAAYALVMAVFGQTIGAIHTGLLLVNAGAILLLFFIGRGLFSPWAGVAASAAYAVLSVCAGVLGTQAHATHFVVLAALGGLLLLLKFRNSGRAATLFASGILFGIAFVMKQHGIFFGVFSVGYLLFTRKWRQIPVFLVGAALPFAITCLLLWHAGVFGRFWFWVFTYASHYVSETSFSDGAAALAENFAPIFRQNAALWIFAGAGLAILWVQRHPFRWFLSALLLFSFTAVCPGLYFRPHYFVPLLPVVALLAGSCVRSRFSAMLFAAAIALCVFAQHDFLLRMTPTEISRDLYGLDPFPEAIPIAAYMRQHSDPAATIGVLGSEPEIYFYARRHSATSYLYTEPLVEPQPFALTMQNDMVRQLEDAAPLYIVRFPIEETLSLSPQSPTRIYDWWGEYGPRHYSLVAIADILPDGRTEYRWDAAAESYKPQSLYHLEVYRRR